MSVNDFTVQMYFVNKNIKFQINQSWITKTEKQEEKNAHDKRERLEKCRKSLERCRKAVASMRKVRDQVLVRDMKVETTNILCRQLPNSFGTVTIDLLTYLAELFRETDLNKYQQSMQMIEDYNQQGEKPTKPIPQAELQDLDENCKIVDVPNQGRGIVSNGKMSYGQYVLVEQAISSVLYLNSQDYYCSECFASLEERIYWPCRGCTKARFCDMFCEENAWKATGFHRLDCCAPIQTESNAEYSPMTHISRIVQLVGLKNLVRIFTESASSNKYHTTENVQQKFTKGFSKRITEMSQEELENVVLFIGSWTKKDMILESLSSEGLQNVGKNIFRIVLKQNAKEKYFNFREDATKEKEKFERLVNELFQIVCKSICYSFSLSEIGSDFTTIKYGNALFVTGSMFNHSCEANCMFFAHKEYLAVSYDSKNPEMTTFPMTIQYYPDVQDADVKERREITAKYGFECQCKRCVEDSDES